MLPTGPLPTPVPVTRTDLTQPAVPLKPRAGSADTVPMGIKGITPPPGPTPKALCPSCHRPVALLKAGKCVYCGAISPGLVPALPATPKGTLPTEIPLPELMVADDMQNRAKWARRIIAFGGMALLIAAMMGACMKM